MISFQVLMQGFLLFVLCLAVHIVLWRWRIPQHDALTLFVLFLVVPGMGLAALLLGRGSILPAGMTVHGLLPSFILHLSLSAVYIASYPAVQAISPSLDITLIIAESPDKSLSEQDIDSHYDDAKLVSARIEDLRRSVLVRKNGEYFELSRTGRVIAGLFSLYRNALGLRPGEG